MSTKRKRNKLPKREAASISKSFFGDLPQDIIVYILTFLPVKTLIRFMSVCKSWYNLTSNRNFIKNHLQKSYSFNYYMNHKLILRLHNKEENHYFIKSLSLNFRDDNKDIDVPGNPTKDVLHNVRILGSCNGLVWISIPDVKAFLWNPSTKISRELTDLVPKSRLHFYYMYGFGYDQIGDDYKLVWMLFAGSAVEKEVKMYSLRTNSLRKIANFPHNVPSIPEGKYVNGVLHWPVASMTIVSLDLGSETYGEIKQPGHDQCNLTSISLGVVEGWLSVFCNVTKATRKGCIDVWVWKEYGNRDSWIKLYTITHKEDPSSFYRVFPLCISMSGEILLELDRFLILYNPTNGKFRNLRGRRKVFTTEVLTYVESLVSPHY